MAKKKKLTEEVNLRNVILSFPNLGGQMFKGKMNYNTDVLLESNDPQVKLLRRAIKTVCAEAFGDDRSEWPEKIPSINDGDERADQKGYPGRVWIKASSKYPIEVVDAKGEPMTPEMVRGGAYANVAINVSKWDNEGEEGVSLYLAGVMVDTKKKGLDFGGGKSVMERFKKGKDDEDQDDEEEDEKPKNKKRPVDEDEDMDKDSTDSEDDEEDYTLPKKKRKKPVYDEDDED